MKIRKLLLTSLLSFVGLLGLVAQQPIEVGGTVYDANGGGQDSVNIQVSVFTLTRLPAKVQPIQAWMAVMMSDAPFTSRYTCSVTPSHHVRL